MQNGPNFNDLSSSPCMLSLGPTRFSGSPALLFPLGGIALSHPPRTSIYGRGVSLLKLKRVDIQGFKSFYDRTEMRFHGSGIAAVVGPNGCGKSNLSDAISWVLGEQSAKTLRGARMEDVIFAGTRERKPLGMAQVTLTMADPAEASPYSAESVNGLSVNGAVNGHSNGHANGHAHP